MKDNKTCKHCGKTIGKDQKVCPYCNEPQTKTIGDYSVYFLWAVVAIGILGLLFFNIRIGGDTLKIENPTNEYELTQDESLDGPQERFEVPENAQDLKIGQTYSSNNVDVTVNNISEWDGDELDDPGDDMTYLLINVTVKNNSGEEYSTFDTDFTGYADGGYVNRDFVTDDNLDADVLIPGAYETGNVAFAVPENWSTFQLRVKNGYESNQTGTYTFSRSELIQNPHHDDSEHHDD